MAVPKWRQAGFATEWQYRKAKAAGEGYSLTEYRKERRAQKAASEGYRSASVRDRIKRTVTDPVAREAAKKADTLAFFGISETRFKRIRTLNRKHAQEQRDREYMLNWSITNGYRGDIDTDLKNWSIDRVGYILSYYGAVVQPSTNYESLFYNPRNKAGYLSYRKWEQGEPLSNIAQFKYLVQYGKLMSQDEFESRYGKNTPVREARNARWFL